MSDHTLTVRFDDDQASLEDIVDALNQAGYTVPGRRQVSSES